MLQETSRVSGLSSLHKAECPTVDDSESNQNFRMATGHASVKPRFEDGSCNKAGGRKKENDPPTPPPRTSACTFST